MTTSGNFKNVVLVGPSLGRRGGMEKLVRLYTTCFDNTVYLPTNSPYGTIVGFFIVLLTCIRLPYYRLKGRNIMHIHIASGKSFFRKSFIAFLGRCLGYKIIIHSHAGDLPQFVEKVGNPIAKAGFSMANLIIALSPYWKNYFKNTLSCRNVAIVPNFSDIESKLRDKGCKVQSVIRFLYLGVLTKEKGVDVLLKAYKDIANRFADQTQLVIVGSGPLVNQLKKYSEREIKHGEVVFTGWVETDECNTLLNNADVFVLPSKYECQPMALIEAMTAGCGIIATRVGGIPDMIEDGVDGFLVDYGDVEMLSDVMARYIETPSLINRHVENVKVKKQIYSYGNVASILERIYGEI